MCKLCEKFYSIDEGFKMLLREEFDDLDFITKSDINVYTLVARSKVPEDPGFLIGIKYCPMCGAKLIK